MTRRTVDAPLPRAKVGDVCHPGFLGAAHRELSLQPIGYECNRMPRSVTRSLVATKGSDFVLFHDAADSLLVAPNARLAKVAPDSRLP
jgi:hypothetical protein